MADTWWFEETKLVIALWSEEAVQHELNTMHNKKLEWAKISQGMADGGYSKSSIAVNIMAAVRKGAILFSTLDCEATLPSIFEFSKM